LIISGRFYNPGFLQNLSKLSGECSLKSSDKVSSVVMPVNPAIQEGAEIRRIVV
jgi:hypothetical protein